MKSKYSILSKFMKVLVIILVVSFAFSGSTKIVYAKTSTVWWKDVKLDKTVKKTDLSKYKNELDLYNKDKNLWWKFNKLVTNSQNKDSKYTKSRTKSGTNINTFYKSVLSKISKNASSIKESQRSKIVEQIQKAGYKISWVDTLGRKKYARFIQSVGIKELSKYSSEEDFLARASDASREMFVLINGGKWYDIYGQYPDEVKEAMSKYSSKKAWLKAIEDGKVDPEIVKMYNETAITNETSRQNGVREGYEIIGSTSSGVKYNVNGRDAVDAVLYISGVAELKKVAENANNEVGKKILIYENDILTFKNKIYADMSYDEKKDFMYEALNGVKRSGLSASNKNKVYNFISEQDGDVEAAIRYVAEDTQSDLAKARGILRPFSGWVGIILGVLSLAIFMFMSLTMILDISYITIPVFNQVFGRKDKKTGREINPLFVSADAWRAVKDSETPGCDQTALQIYLRTRVISLILMSVCLMYLVSGKIYDAMAWFVDSFSGFLYS